MTHPMSDLPQYPPQPTYSNVPIPDPSLITEREIAKAKADIRHETELMLTSLKTELVARMEGRAALNDQKFENVAMRFTERDRRGQLIVESNRDAIASALAAQKEDTTGKYEANRNAATKLESYFAHQTEQTQQLLQEMRRSTEDKITDIKERLDKGEGTQKGGQDTRSEQRMNTGHIMGIIGGVVGMLALLWTISQGFLVGNNERKISALLRDTNIVPPGYVLVPAPTAGK